MCSIFGIFSVKRNYLSSEEAKSVIKTLKNEMLHRGPDSFGIKFIDEYCVLGHTRLAINDINGGDQPFINKQEELASVVNGEIYNYKEIREYLLSKEKHLFSGSDCEVVSHCLNFDDDLTMPKKELKGMYAAAIYNRKAAPALHLARDTFGEKPLYYFHDENKVIFSSEFKPLAKVIQTDAKDISFREISDFMIYGYGIGLNTMHQRIKASPPGKLLTFKIYNEVCIKIEEKSIYSRSNFKGEDLEKLVTEYIENSTISDVPICMGLSGGKDSGLIASLLKHKIDCSFTVGYESSGGSDEIYEASEIAKFNNIKNIPIIIDNNEVASLFQRQVLARDVPSSDIAGIAYYKLFETASNHGYKVILMGHGGDELYLGYPWLFDSYNINRKNFNSSFLYETLPDFRVYNKYLSTVCTKKIYDYKWYDYRLDKEEMVKLPLRSSAYKNTLELITNYWLEPNSLRMADSLSMAKSIESRHPLLCFEASQVLNSKEEDMAIPESKFHLTNLINKNLDISLIQKKKKYFSPPIMEFYSLIHEGLRKQFKCESVLIELGLINEEIYKMLFMEDFNVSQLTYYYFGRVATLELWLRELI